MSNHIGETYKHIDFHKHDASYQLTDNYIHGIIKLGIKDKSDDGYSGTVYVINKDELESKGIYIWLNSRYTSEYVYTAGESSQTCILTLSTNGTRNNLIGITEFKYIFPQGFTSNVQHQTMRTILGYLDSANYNVWNHSGLPKVGGTNGMGGIQLINTTESNVPKGIAYLDELWVDVIGIVY